MNPVSQLRKLLVPDPRVMGTVVSVIGDAITVSTARGTVSVSRPAGDATAYSPGDGVLLVNGQLAGRRRGAPTIYVL